VLGGASITGTTMAISNFLGTGFLLLPILFIIGIAQAFGKKEFFPVYLAAMGIGVLLVTTNYGLNAAYPFIDGIRFLPSFFLPVFFLSGIGCCSLWSSALETGDDLRARLKLDRVTFAGAAVLAVILPLSAFYLSDAMLTLGQYSLASHDLQVASEYVSLQRAYAISGGSFGYEPSHISQYSVIPEIANNVSISGFSSADGAAALMLGWNKTYLLLGFDSVAAPGYIGRDEMYSELANDSRFREIGIGTASRLFEFEENTGSTQTAATKTASINATIAPGGAVGANKLGFLLPTFPFLVPGGIAVLALCSAVIWKKPEWI
jgi:hypothetical protein